MNCLKRIWSFLRVGGMVVIIILFFIALSFSLVGCREEKQKPDKPKKPNPEPDPILFLQYLG
jgi:hypothetical protein